MKKEFIVVLFCALLLISCTAKEPAQKEVIAPLKVTTEKIVPEEKAPAPEKIPAKVPAAKPEVNTAPVIPAISDKVITEGQLFTLNVGAVDADRDKLTYSITTPPFTGITINQDGMIIWQTKLGDNRIYQFTVSVSDSKTTSRQTFSLNVLKAAKSIYGLVLDLNLDDETTSAGTIFGSPILTLGKRGNTLLFDGVDDYIEVPKTDALKLGGSGFSISMWVRESIADGLPKIFISDRDESGNGLVIGKGADEKVYYSIKDRRRENMTFKSDVTMSDLQWHHIVLIRDYGNDFELYIDGFGKEVMIDELKETISSMNWLIGKDPTAKDYFNGAIDEVKIFNRALTAKEVLILNKID